MQYNSQFEDTMDNINNIAQGYGFVNGIAWANRAQKAGEISYEQYKKYENAHKLRVRYSHGNARDISVTLETYQVVKNFERDIKRSKIRNNTNSNATSRYKPAYTGRKVIGNRSEFEIVGTTLKKYLGKDTSVKIPFGVTSIGEDAFLDCNVESAEIPNSVISIGKGAFICLDSLKSIVIPNSVMNIGDSAFHSCESLESIVIPNSVVSIGYSAFFSCKSLTSVKIPDSVTSIGSSAFFGCDRLKSITIPNSVTSIEEGTFGACVSLTSVKIPDGVTSIGAFAFANCDRLKSIAIPSSVISIEYGAFSNCSSLTHIMYSGTKRLWRAVVTDDSESWDSFRDYSIHCVDGDLTMTIS